MIAEETMDVEKADLLGKQIRLNKQGELFDTYDEWKNDL